MELESARRDWREARVEMPIHLDVRLDTRLENVGGGEQKLGDIDGLDGGGASQGVVAQLPGDLAGAASAAADGAQMPVEGALGGCAESFDGTVRLLQDLPEQMIESHGDSGAQHAEARQLLRPREAILQLQVLPRDALAFDGVKDGALQRRGALELALHAVVLRPGLQRRPRQLLLMGHS